jgi:hypothetical protein
MRLNSGHVGMSLIGPLNGDRCSLLSRFLVISAMPKQPSARPVRFPRRRLLTTLKTRPSLSPDRKRLRERALARRPLLDSDDDSLAVPVNHWDVEPRPLFEKLDIALHVDVDR